MYYIRGHVYIILTPRREGGVSNMLTNVYKCEGGSRVKTMFMLARGVEASYRKPKIYAVKFAFQGAIFLFSIIDSSGKLSTVKKSSCSTETF